MKIYKLENEGNYFMRPMAQAYPPYDIKKKES